MVLVGSGSGGGTVTSATGSTFLKDASDDSPTNGWGHPGGTMQVVIPMVEVVVEVVLVEVLVVMADKVELTFRNPH